MRETADPGAPQRGEVAAAAEGGTEVARERPDVGARRHGDLDVDVEHRDAVDVAGAGLADGEPRHRDRARGELDALAAAHPVVGALALDLDRADRARHLLDVTGERPAAAHHGIPRRRRPAPADAVTSPSASSVSVAWPSRIVAV